MPFEIRHDADLTGFNSFGIAARAGRLVTIDSVEALHALRDSPEWDDGERLVLGGGSNVLFARDFDGLVIRIALRGREVLGDDGDHRIVSAMAGEDWDGFVRHTLVSQRPGLENLVAIPGSVGASPVQNIGAYGVELDTRFAWLDAFDVEARTTVRMDAAACGFAYRDSVFKHAWRDRAIITRVGFRLPLRWEPQLAYGDVRARLDARGISTPTAMDVADAVTSIRREKLPDPAVVGNAGSFFKNPVVSHATFDAIRAHEPDVVGHPQREGTVKLAAGWMIDRCGWRGRSLDGSDGRAAVHDRHALVLVNRGGATGADVLALAAAIRDDVSKRFGVSLETEPLVVGA